ncbi:MAG: hypothetical protein LBU82_05160 [Treponema sp.]|nr:hypothetical protein [Treponema sp.]
MNKRINFEDTIYILNVRIRMIRDLLQLDTDSDLFFHQTVEDLKFISSTLGVLTDKLIANPKFVDRELEADNLSDAEWQFNQIVCEFLKDCGSFPPAQFAEISSWISTLREESAKRQKLINEAYVPEGTALTEPVVTYTELSRLLGTA